MAVQMTHGPLLVIAGPGTGKTRVLTHRAAYLMDCGIVAPDRCLMITFSRRAASEMAQRLAQLLPKVGGHVPVLTFPRLGTCHHPRAGQTAGTVQTLPRVGRGGTPAAFDGDLHISQRKADRTLARVSQLKRGVVVDSRGEDEDVCQTYQKLLADRGLSISMI